MSRYKRFGLLPIYKSNQDQDWKLDGYYNNFKSAIQYIPRDTLVSFRTPPVAGSYTAPTKLTIRKLSIKGGIKTIVSSADYTVTVNKQEIDAGSESYYYFNQSAISTNISEFLDAGCIYEIYLEDSEGNSFISNIFVAIDESQIFIYAESNEAILTEDGEQILFE